MNIRNLIKIARADDFYILLEDKEWGLNCRVFTSQYGAVRTATDPGWETTDCVANFPHKRMRHRVH